MAEIVASAIGDPMKVTMDYDTYLIEANDDNNPFKSSDSLWVLERGQVLVLIKEGLVKNEIISGYKCYYCGRGWHIPDYDTLDIPLEGSVAVCKDEWGCKRRIW